MIIAHDKCFFKNSIFKKYFFNCQEQFLSNFYAVLFSFAVIALDGRILCELFFLAPNLDLVFAISPRLWRLVAVASCGS